jgi:SAM-dependent methyltransferase
VNQGNDTLSQWQETANYWTKHHDVIRTMFAPLTRALIEQAHIDRDQTVLDVAGGAGEPSLTIAQVVGPRGSVMCTDAISEMVAAAEREAIARSVKNVQFRQCTAESLPFADDSFDVAVSRLGIMFFPNPLAGVREMLRAVKTGGHIALAVWGKSELNPYSYVVTDVISRHVQSPKPDPDAPDAFRFAQPGKLAALLKESDAIDVAECVVDFDIAAPMSPEEFWAFRSEISESLRSKLNSLSAEQRDQIGREVVDAVRQFFDGSQISFPAQMMIASGKKGRSVKYLTLPQFDQLS